MSGLFTGSSGKKARRREAKQFEGGSKAVTGIDPVRPAPIAPRLARGLGPIRTPLSAR